MTYMIKGHLKLSITFIVYLNLNSYSAETLYNLPDKSGVWKLIEFIPILLFEKWWPMFKIDNSENNLL